MAFDYYYRGESEEEEVIIQTVDSGRPLAAKKRIKRDHSW